MIAYHGSAVQGLTILKPFAKQYSNLKYACVYLSTNKAIASLYIWNKPYMWLNYGFDADGTPVYTESFPNALHEFYGGLPGCVYTCEGDFEVDANAKIKVAVISRECVPVIETDIIPDAYERIMEYEEQGYMRISRYENLADEKRKAEHDMIISAIKRFNLRDGVHPLAPFVKEKFPEIWAEAGG